MQTNTGKLATDKTRLNCCVLNVKPKYLNNLFYIIQYIYLSISRERISCYLNLLKLKLLTARVWSINQHDQ